LVTVGSTKRSIVSSKHARNRPSVCCTRGERGFQMIMLKLVAVALGAGLLFSMYSGDLGADVVLAIVSCLA
jgi:hypothetical protein